MFKSHAVTLQSSTSHTLVSLGLPVAIDNAQANDHDIEILADNTQSLAERRARRMNCHLPARYRDVFPQPPPPPLVAPSILQCLEPQASLSVSSRDFTLGFSSIPCVLRFFTTLANSFGLSRWYYGHQPLSHDPEITTTLQDLTLRPPVVDVDDSAELQVDSRDIACFYPYPNISSFLLGDWYWNGGIEKSKERFKELIKIVGASEFQPQDVSSTHWDSINAKLQAEEMGPNQPFEGAGWTKTAVTIKVPFHKWAAKPGVYDYHVGDMYHCTLVSIVREKLSNLHHNEFFHYQPYNLLWQRGGSVPVNVHGELYTSEAFLQAHQDLQQSPPEPGCDLEHVVVTLMFWSDATQLTSFGNAKLWPCYMFFGNKLKYRRCRPSCCLCNHVAYFNHVCIPVFS